MTLNEVNSAIYLTATLGNLFHIELLNYLALLPCGIAAYFLIRERSAIKILFTIIMIAYGIASIAFIIDTKMSVLELSS